MKRVVFHVDVNNAYLSWSACEMLKNGAKNDIRNEVSVIGGSEEKRNGIVLAKSMLAKKYGIITAETLSSARKKFKNLKVYPPLHNVYYERSSELYHYLKSLTPLIEQYSVDECFLDFTGIKVVSDNPVKFATEIKEHIKNTFGYTVNVGIGNNKLCAKMASDFLKPDRVHTLFDTEIKEKMWPLKIDDLFMVGRKNAIKLKEMGINTIGALAAVDEKELINNFKKYGVLLHEYSNGIDNSTVENNFDLKGVGNSFTYPYDLNNIVDVKNKLLELSCIVGRRIRKRNKKAFVITVWVKFSDFRTITKQKKLDNPISSDADIYNESVKIIKSIKFDSIRSLGVRLTSFSDKNVKQISLFDSDIDDNKTNDNIDNVLDNLKDKYGENIIKKGM